MKTWKEFREEALSGLPDDVVEQIRKLTAFKRQALRVREVRRLAEQFLMANGLTIYDYHVRALCALESGGTRGGGTACPGAGASRHTAFKSLPRRDKDSSAPWDVAINAVAAAWAWGVKKDELCIVIPIQRDDIRFVPVVTLADDTECTRVAARRAIRAAAYDLWPHEMDTPEEAVHDHQATAVIVAAATLLRREARDDGSQT